MYAGVAGMSAEEAWYTTAILIEQARIHGVPIPGASVDIHKCFDQLQRPLLYALAKEAGMPPAIIDAYVRFQELLVTRNTIHKGLGEPYRREAGIPQGCPLSMMYTALLLRPWILKMRSKGIKSRTLADDMLIITKGPRHLTKFKEGLDITHDFLHDLGAV